VQRSYDANLCGDWDKGETLQKESVVGLLQLEGEGQMVFKVFT